MTTIPADVIELIDSYRIVKHACECECASVLLKGSSFEDKYIKSLDELNELHHKLKQRLIETGPLTVNGILWDANKFGLQL